MSKLKSYEAIAHSKLNTARSRVQSLIVQHRIAKHKLDRFAALLQEGAISQQTFDTLNSQLAVLEGDLSAAQAELRIAQTANVAVRNGSFYDGNHLVGELPRLTTEVEDWRQGVQLASQKVTALQQVLYQQEQDVQRLARQKQALQRLSANVGTSELKVQPEATPGTALSKLNSLSVVYRSPFSGSVRNCGHLAAGF